MSSGQIFLSKDRFLQVSSSLDHNQHPLLLAGQGFLTPLHLCTCDGGAHCCIAFLVLVMVECIVGVGLLAALPKSYVCWCSFVEINHVFCMNFQSAIRQPTCCLLSMVMSLPPAIGPTLGANFSVVMGFKLSPSEGVASHALGLQCSRQRQRQLMLINDVYCSGPGYGQEDSHIQLRKEGSSTKK